LFCGQLEPLSGSQKAGVDLAIWQNRKIELWSQQVMNPDRQSDNPAMSPHNLAKWSWETSKSKLGKIGK